MACGNRLIAANNLLPLPAQWTNCPRQPEAKRKRAKRKRSEAHFIFGGLARQSSLFLFLLGGLLSVRASRVSSVALHAASRKASSPPPPLSRLPFFFSISCHASFAHAPAFLSLFLFQGTVDIRQLKKCALASHGDGGGTVMST
jgi:hypothetical protein